MIVYAGQVEIDEESVVQAQHVAYMSKTRDSISNLQEPIVLPDDTRMFPERADTTSSQPVQGDPVGRI